jgi:DNA mismatch repair protein Mlh1 C-terminus
VEILVQRRDMISEYFSMNITSDGVLESVPLLLKNYTPHYGKLPTFIRRLGRNVDSQNSNIWTNVRLTGTMRNLVSNHFLENWLYSILLNRFH